MGERWLRADYGINCDSSKHKAFQLYAGFMILVGVLSFVLVCVRAYFAVQAGRARWLLRCMPAPDFFFSGHDSAPLPVACNWSSCNVGNTANGVVFCTEMISTVSIVAHALCLTLLCYYRAACTRYVGCGSTVTLVLRLSFPRNMLASEVFRLSEIAQTPELSLPPPGHPAV